MKIINGVLVYYDPNLAPNPEEALGQAFNVYKTCFFNKYSEYPESQVLRDLNFSQDLESEAPALLQNPDCQDAHLVLRGIRGYETIRFVDHQNAIQNYNGNIYHQIPLTQNLRRPYMNISQQLVTPNSIDLEEDLGEFVSLLQDENPNISFWPADALDKSYHLYRSGFHFESEEADSFQTVNNISDSLGLTNLVEQDRERISIPESRQLHIREEIVKTYEALPPHPGHTGSITLSSRSDIFPIEIVFVGVLYFCFCYVGSFFRNKKKMDETIDFSSKRI